MEQLVEWELERKSKELGENLLQCYCVHTNPPLLGSGLNSG
jgi:hypothetical protein